MRTYSAAAYEGRVIFHARPISLAAYELMENLESAAKEAMPQLPEKYAGVVKTLIHLLSLSPNIEFHFDGNEGVILLDLRDFWEGFSKHLEKAAYVKAMKLAIDWRMNTDQELINQWVDVINTAQFPYRRPEQLPFDQLTEAEKAEALTPDSPLPQGA